MDRIPHTAESPIIQAILTAAPTCLGTCSTSCSSLPSGCSSLPSDCSSLASDTNNQNTSNIDEFGFYPWMDEHNGRLKTNTTKKKTASKNNRKENARKTFSQSAQNELELEFRMSPYLTAWKRQYLAGKLNLTERQVRVWFQNRRMRIKNEQRNKRRAAELEKVISVRKCTTNPSYAEICPSFSLASPASITNYQSSCAEMSANYHSANQNQDNYRVMSPTYTNVSDNQPTMVQQTDGLYQYGPIQHSQTIVPEMQHYITYPTIHTNAPQPYNYPYYNNGSENQFLPSSSYSSRL